MKRGGQIAIWAITIICFGSPFIFFMMDQNIDIQKTELQVTNQVQKPYHLTIHVSGDIQNHGIYKVAVGTKVHELIGYLELGPNAVIDHLNLAKPLRDGQKVVIKTKRKSKLNINLATIKQLESLSGIGEATARKIMDYRELVGGINNKDQLSRLIGQSRANKISNQIQY